MVLQIFHFIGCIRKKPPDWFTVMLPFWPEILFLLWLPTLVTKQNVRITWIRLILEMNPFQGIRQFWGIWKKYSMDSKGRHSQDNVVESLSDGDIQNKHIDRFSRGTCWKSQLHLKSRPFMTGKQWSLGVFFASSVIACTVCVSKYLPKPVPFAGNCSKSWR